MSPVRPMNTDALPPAVADYLADLGVPLADVLGTLFTFVVALVVLYYVGNVNAKGD